MSLVVDLRDTAVLGPDALEALSEAGDRLRRRGGDLVLSAPAPPVLDALTPIVQRGAVKVTRV